MRQRLFNKYFITATIIILFSLGVMMMIMTFVYNDYLADMKYETLNKTSSNIAKLIEENVETSESFSDNSELKSALKVTLNQISDIDSTDVFIADNTGKIIISGSEDTVLNIPLEFFAKSKTQGMETLGIYSKLHYYTYQKIYSDSKDVLGYVVVTAPFTEIKALMTRVAKLYLLSAIIPIVAMFFALYGITYRMTKPLKLMSDAAKAMSKGDFSKRIPVTSDDEIGELAVSFNQMTNSLSRLEEMRKGFVADISHEFKTPLTTIGGFIDGITDGTIEPEKQGYYLNIVSGEVKRLTRMVQSMLSLARIESSDFVLKYETFDFKELLIGILLNQEQRIENKGITVKGLEELPSVTVNADKDLIHRVVYNLVDNAVKFTNANGTIKCEIKTDAKNLTFGIENTGVGIPNKELPYVFERFYKTDKSRSVNKESTGLGLYMVKTIIKSHGGTVKVASKENEFTLFTFTLPLTK